MTTVAATTDSPLTTKQQGGIKNFQEVYESLIMTLVDTYPEHEGLQGFQRAYRWSAQLAHDWYAQFIDVEDRVNQHDEKLMTTDAPPALTALLIPELWQNNKLTTQSKKYMWMYVSKLYYAAKAFAGQENGRDIAPPKLSGEPTERVALEDGLQELCKTIPPSMMLKAKTLAAKYEGANASEVKFDEVSQELFSNINPDEMQQLMQGVGGMINSLTKQTGDGDGSDNLNGLMQMMQMFKPPSV